MILQVGPCAHDIHSYPMHVGSNCLAPQNRRVSYWGWNEMQPNLWVARHLLGLFGSFCGWNPTLVSQDLIDIFFRGQYHIFAVQTPLSYCLKSHFAWFNPNWRFGRPPKFHTCVGSNRFFLRKASNLAASTLNPSAPPPSSRAESCLNHLDPAGSRLLKWSISPAKNGLWWGYRGESHGRFIGYTVYSNKF